MKLRKMTCLILCLGLVCLSVGLTSAAYAHTDSDIETETETNVITESDAGGGDLSQKDLLWIILGVLVLVLLIVAI
jgi:hypothetical protein